jgi:Tfp pilus assembly protein PilO
MKKFQTLPWYIRLAAFLGVALVMYLGFWFLITRGTRKETTELEAKIEALKPRNAQAQIAQQRLNEFRKIFQGKTEEYDELKALLPEQRELTTVLQGVQDRARTTSLSLRRFSPKDDFQQDFYSGKNIDVAVTSSFAGLRAFFDQMAHYQRIVSITNFEITQFDNKQSPNNTTVSARFDMTAYYVSAEKLQKQATPAKPGAAPAVAPAAPAAPATK